MGRPEEQPLKSPPGADPIRLTWLITILGCAAGVVMIAIVAWTFADIRAERYQLERFKAGLIESRARIEQALLADKETIYALLFAERPASGNGTPPRLKLRAMVADYRKMIANPGMADTFADLEKAVAALDDLANRSSAWSGRRAGVLAQLSASRQRVEETLTRLDEMVQRAYGRKRLGLAGRIREYRRAGEHEESELGRRLIADLPRIPDLSAIRRDLADLAVLCERLRGEERLDFLADIKDNRIRTTLVRLRRQLEITPELEGGPALLGDFEAALFGTGYVIENEHQTVVPGVGGLYGLALTRLELAEEGEQLRLEAASRFDAISRLLRDLTGPVESIASERVLRVESSLRTAWRTMLMLWLGTGALFVLISTRIIRAVKRQVQAIGETNRALLASREELRDSEERLHRLSSSLLTAQENERRRIARELHDELGQAMAALKLQARAAERSIGDPAPPALKEECRHLREAISEIIENMRRLSRDLSPVVLEDLGFEAAVEHLTGTFAALYGVKVELAPAEISHLLSREAQLNIYRILQELLNNIGKHAGAGRVRVTICRRDSELLFTVEDDGKGFDVAQVKGAKATEKGLGLTAVSERVRLLTGRLEIMSEPGAGTTVTIGVPLA
ncbi:MAG: sensor histidine kinase [Desulfobacteraceae bacterium]|nr:sensor histidine kinase [Desulfobacteraceae bacterium]